MTELLFLGLVILGFLLLDTRGRLARLERQLREQQFPMSGEELPRAAQAERPWRSAVIVDQPPQEAPEVESEALPPPEPISAPEPVQMLRIEPEQEALVAPLAAPQMPPAPAEPVDLVVMAEAQAEATAPSGYQPASFSFEDLFGRKLPIWAGGITLVVAAVLLVKYSVDAGLLAPFVRVLFGLLFGALLIGGAELARRRADLVQDPRISQALSGAGIGSLYAATLAAANLYGLIGPGTAFAGLAAITALAMLLATRFGAPSAVLGLVGGLATPAVIQSGPPNVPLLTGYIAVVVGGLTLLSRRQRWMWLGVSALIGGAGWSLVMILMGGLGQVSMLSVGLLVLLLGIGLPLFASSERSAPLLRGVSALVASLQLALLVATGDYAPLSWGLYGLLSIAFVWLSEREPKLRPNLPVPLIAALALAAFWPHPPLGLFSAVIAGIMLIYGGAAVWRIWRADGSLTDAAMIALASLGGYLLCHLHFYSGLPGQDARFAGLAAAFALLPALALALGWRDKRRREDWRFALAASTGGLLLVIAALLALPAWLWPVGIAAIAVALLVLALKAGDSRLPHSALACLGGGLIALLGTDTGDTEIMRFVQYDALAHPAQALLRWGALALAAAAFAWRSGGTPRGAALQSATVLLGYGFLAQCIPAPWLAIASAFALLGLADLSARKGTRALLPAIGATAAIAGLWALLRFSEWLLPAMASLAGEPMLITLLPQVGDAMRQLLAPMLITGIALWRIGALIPRRVQIIAAGIAGALGIAGIHILYKQLFAIADESQFVTLGLAERTLWEAALIAIGFGIWRALSQRNAALAFIAVGLAHNLLYTLLLHNPLWTQQAVGSIPLANLLLPAFGIAFAVPMLVTRMVPQAMAYLRRPADLLRMAAVLLFAFASLRQLFAGTMLAGSPIGPVENIGWSVLAIALAIGFLLWGIRQGQRDWRIASLVLMLAAVAKVFLLDASGLEGLLRIASFLALGFSLIGIGWLYSRYLRPDAAS